ncbi:MAG: virulence factor SrfB [Bacteroidetes bacterium]|nr:virulence factor SrfB [Bacteroidota bacterium]MBU1718042.1 virulence factor SrfB [Bacteroidota bacterium]
MNLIANTGIQLFTFPFEVNLDNNFKMFFHEWLDLSDHQKKLEIAHSFPDADIWIKKNILYGNKLGYATLNNNYRVTETWETISNDDEFEKSCIIPIDTEDERDSGCFEMSVSKIKEPDWKKIETTWFPMPFFQLNGRRSDFGPTNWCRFKLIPNGHEGRTKKYNILLAFDTRTVFMEEGFEDEDLQETPIFTNAAETSKNYALCNTEEGLLGYCSADRNCNWVDKYILKQFHGIDNIDDRRLELPKMRYLAQFIFLNRYIQQFASLPTITLFSNRNAAYGNVDMVVDIGNSRTCAVLFDNSDFTRLSPLELQNFTSFISEGTLNKCRDSFDMRLAFRKADFGGEFGLDNSRQFVYPSMIRLGKEANKLIHQATNMNTGAEKTSTFSSPKRFLWDEKPQKQEWEFVQLQGETAQPIYIEGISEQLKEDGTLGDGSIKNRYSRKALMTFAFLEILAQAKMQINSQTQRNHWGNESMPRKIGRIIVTCPTAMSHKEQIALRKCAEDAAIMLDRFFDNTYSAEIDETEYRKRVQVIPSAKKLSLNEERAEWIFDEATAAQFVFLYAEIKERYQKNVKDYFDLYGKIRRDLDGYNKKSLTVGSVDIGAGTTDVMIASYKYDDSSAQCTLRPIPMYWESFYLAGDDLMKQLVQQLVIEGRNSPIEQKLRQLGKNPVEILQPFLGTDTGVSFQNRRLRNDFNLQVSVPIVLHYLELLNENKDDAILSYRDIFEKNPPTQKVFQHFRESFGFDFTELQWTYKKRVLADIMEKTFDSLIGKISSLLSYYECDIVLLSGRPTSLKPLSDLFLKYYAISPNRLKSMNDYRVGRWYPEDKRYPFINGNGRFINPKSIITTGAMIGQIAGNGGLNGFALDLTDLKKKLLPTTYYFGKLNEESLAYLNTIISPDNNFAKFDISSFPCRIGVRQIDIPAYPTRPFYTLDFNDFKIEDRVLGRFDEDNPPINQVQQEIQKEKDTIRRGMPLKVSISRDINEDIEKLTLEEVTDREGNSLNKNFFSLQVQSLSEVENFWLDSGIFSLNINELYN